MNQSHPSVVKIGLASVVPLTLLLSACTVYQDSPAPSAPVTYVESPAEDDSGYVVIHSENDFYEPLGAYGHWEDVGGEGPCWIPGRVDRDWRPYSSGNWRRTDAGWYWDSDEPWGWATYHYGRWDRDDRLGWYWVPQTQWAPSWVSWHEGGGYVGWAPLRPSGRSRQGVSVDVRIENDSPPQAYVFVQEKQFLQPVRRTNIIVNNTTIINQTTNITNVKVVNKTVINEGPRTEVIERATGQKVQPVSARTVRREHEAKVTVPHQSPNASGEAKKTMPAPNNPPVHNPQPAPAPKPAPVVSNPESNEKDPHDQPKRGPSGGQGDDRQIRPDRQPEGETRKENVAPVSEQKKPDDKAKPKVEKPKKPAPKEQPKHVKESPEQLKHDAEKQEAEKRAKEKESEASDQPGKSEPQK